MFAKRAELLGQTVNSRAPLLLDADVRGIAIAKQTSAVIAMSTISG